MKISKHRTILGLIAIAAVIGGAAMARDWNRSHAAPPKTADEIVSAARPSTIVLPIVASIADIQSKLNEQIPEQLFAIDENRDACVPAQWIDECIVPKIFKSGCAVKIKTKITPDIDCHLQGWVRRGPIQVGGSDATLTFSMPVDLSVTARGRGDIGKHIQETATGSAAVAASATVDIDENWQPSAAVAADYSWNDRIGVDILGFRITFASKVDPRIKDAIAAFQRGLPDRLAELDIKRKASEAWAKAAATIQVVGDPPVWLRFSPTTVGYGGYTVADQKISLRLMAEGGIDTHVGEKPADAKPVDLPRLARNLPDSGLNFYVPVFADYTELREAALAALGSKSSHDVEIPNVGKVKVTVRDIQFHQTTGRALAVGVTLEADPAGSFFDTNGTIWLTSRLVVDNASKIVTAENLAIFGDTDNLATDLLVQAAQVGPIRDVIRSAATFDFREQYDDAIAKLNEALRRQIAPDFYFEGQVDGIAVESVAAGKTAVQLGIAVNGSGQITFGQLSN